jgi:hypothetical protein
MKYGFVYIWRDRKYKRYYIGCRWGNIYDGYICSSPWMKQAYKKRPHDFKRRILSLVYTNKKDLLEEEYRWLSMMKLEELKGERYYNLHNYRFNHWSADDNKRASIGEKISKSPNRAANISKASRGRQFSSLAKQRQREVMVGRKQTEEEKAKRAATCTGRKFKWKNPGTTKGMLTVVDIKGNTYRINKHEFDNAPPGLYATVRSHEGKRRRGLMI